MLSEFECETCGTKFVAAFMEVRPGFPMRHCVACGGEDLKILGSKSDQGPQQSEIAAMMERVFHNLATQSYEAGGIEQYYQRELFNVIGDEFHKLTEGK